MLLVFTVKCTEGHRRSLQEVEIEDQVSPVGQENEQLCLVFVDVVDEPREIISSYDQSIGKKER